ncbi:MAG: 3-deoxy-manno-octulosonate cytidylyltransferase [Elusimicrobia bacterium]|jgi:3-deoxy-manno-octulosonate cytidylyltransferase (CMP-KDO synthetase)|nr:3-deoxy-manno-octulosonate cytidylyltransferase [Elusimicrobiota bacterium]
MKKETIICIIPARYGSERLQGKVLYKINGKTILRRVYERAKKIKQFSAIYIATDDDRIAEEGYGMGAGVIMTSSNCMSGSDRAAEAAKDMKADIIVNIQADEPFLPAEAVEKPLEMMRKDKKLYVVTSSTRIRKAEELYDPNIVKIVFDEEGNTLYSSRALIPYPSLYFSGSAPALLKKVRFYKHIGVYLFRKDFLATFHKLPLTPLERIEKLEQLRIIENGYTLKTAVIQKDSPCVDTLEDIKKLQAA